MEFSRRQFLGTSAAAVIAAGTVAKGKVFGANDKIRVCCIGLNGRGQSHIKEVFDNKDAELVALCDVDKHVLDGRAKFVEERHNKKVKKFVDMRDVMASKDIDAIMIATPNHWHSLAAIWGCEAGKDVYVEKPLCHNIWEGKQLVAAAAKYKRMVQHGTQSRSDATLMRDIKLMHEGFIGDIVHSRGYVYKNGNRSSIGHGKPGKPPEFLDWKLWQGPSPDHDYLVREDGRGLFVPYNWHWFWEYGNGEIGNQGVHEIDIAAWGHNRGLPVKVYSTGGRYGWDDDGQTPNTQATSYTFADGSMLTFEVRNLGSYAECAKETCSDAFFGTKGYYQREVGFFDYKNKPIAVPADAPKPESPGNFGSWFKAIKSRKVEDLTAPVDKGYASCVLIGLGNAAYRLGRSLEFDPKTEKFKDEDANKYLTREYRKDFEPKQLA